jgi:chromate transporter
MALQIIMGILAIYGIVTDKDMKINRQGISITNLIKEEFVWFLFFFILSIPAIFLLPNFLNFITRGYFSSIISFGGGDAYLTVADSLFVTNNMVSESEFYGHLATIVNVLPGSILCKTLTGIGYYIGYNVSGSVLQGCAVALSGFACSIVGSCSVVSFVQYILRLFERIKALEVLTTWIKTIISGLLGSVILSLIYQCLNVAQQYGGFEILILLELAVIYIVNLLISKFTNLSTGVRVIISGAIALLLGNLILG